MTYDCYSDYEPTEFYSRSSPVARKEHRCTECSGSILPGEEYEYVCAKVEGDLCVIKTCQRCRDLRVWVTSNIPCACWAHGSADDGLFDSILDAVDRAPEETKGIIFGFLRRKLARKRFNTERQKGTR